jgi:hypothetical protein
MISHVIQRSESDNFCTIRFISMIRIEWYKNHPILITESWYIIDYMLRSVNLANNRWYLVIQWSESGGSCTIRFVSSRRIEWYKNYSIPIIKTCDIQIRQITPFYLKLSRNKKFVVIRKLIKEKKICRYT